MENKKSNSPGARKSFEYSVVFISIVGILFFIIFLVVMLKMFYSNLSNTEVSILAVALSIVTTAAGILVTMRVADKTLEEQLRMYGRLAMRRIVQSIKSCKALVETLEEKHLSVKEKGFPNTEAADEYFNNITGQACRLTSAILDTREDWRDILQNESREADEIDKEYAELIVEFQIAQKRLIEAKEALKQGKQDKEKIEKLESENKRIKDELVKKKKEAELHSFEWPTGSSLASSPGVGFSLIGGASATSLISTLGNICGRCGSLLFVTEKCSQCGQYLCNLCDSYSILSPQPLSIGRRLCRTCQSKG